MVDDCTITLVNVSKLSTDNISIRYAPKVITDSAPGIVVAELNSSFISSGATNKSDITIRTNWACFTDNNNSGLIKIALVLYLFVALSAYRL